MPLDVGYLFGNSIRAAETGTERDQQEDVGTHRFKNVKSVYAE